MLKTIHILHIARPHLFSSCTATANTLFGPLPSLSLCSSLSPFSIVTTCFRDAWELGNGIGNKQGKPRTRRQISGKVEDSIDGRLQQRCTMESAIIESCRVELALVKKDFQQELPFKCSSLQLMGEVINNAESSNAMIRTIFAHED